MLLRFSAANVFQIHYVFFFRHVENGSRQVPDTKRVLVWWGVSHSWGWPYVRFVGPRKCSTFELVRGACVECWAGELKSRKTYKPSHGMQNLILYYVFFLNRIYQLEYRSSSSSYSSKKLGMYFGSLVQIGFLRHGKLQIWLLFVKIGKSLNLRK